MYCPRCEKEKNHADTGELFICLSCGLETKKPYRPRLKRRPIIDVKMAAAGESMQQRAKK